MILINFSDGVYTKETQDRLQELLSQLTSQELDTVQRLLDRKLKDIEKRNGELYEVCFVPNIPLQIKLHYDDINKPLQYGVHYDNHIDVIKLSDVDKIKGRFGELLILAHEIGHAILGEKNYELKRDQSTWLMEKATDEAIKSYLYSYKNLIPIFYEMYYLCRDTHHYKTKEGDFKEFFKDIISILELEWEEYKRHNYGNN